MIRKYGKHLDIRSINRNLNKISALIDKCKVSANKYDFDKRSKRGKCVICGSKERTLFLTVYEKHLYYECKKCGALTLKPYPDHKELFDMRVELVAKPKVKFIIDVIHNSGEHAKTWLDIGCGGGKLLYYLKTSGIDINGMGFESDTEELKFSKNIGLDVHEKFIDPDNIDDEITQLINSSDVVSFFNVLEHIEKYINYLYESMKTGAWLVVEVPRHPSLGSFANLTSNNRIYGHIIPPFIYKYLVKNHRRFCSMENLK